MLEKEPFHTLIIVERFIYIKRKNIYFRKKETKKSAESYG